MGRLRGLDTTPVRPGDSSNDRTGDARHRLGETPQVAPDVDRPPRARLAYPRDQAPRPAHRVHIGTAGRLATFHALVIATVLGIVVVQFTQAFANRYRTTITRDLAENITSFSQSAAARPATQTLGAFAHSFLASHSTGAGDLLIISVPSRHVTLGTKGSGPLSAVPKIAALLRHPPSATVMSRITVKGTPEQVMVTPIVEAGKVVGTFVTAGSLTGYDQTRTRVLELAIGEGLITLLAASASMYVLLRRLLGSVHRLTRTARDIGLRGALDVRLDDQRTSDEVGEMAATFDAMIDRIDAAMSGQRRLLADVSHQLRTPLTAMRGHLEVMSRGSLDDPADTRATISVVVAQVDHMRSLVERLLLLGRSLEVDFAALEPVDLRSLLGDIADASKVLAPRRWELGPIPDVVLRADPEKLRGAVLNLIDNAVNATGPTDTIRLSAKLQGSPEFGFADIEVDDSGPGIPLDERSQALGRFSRPSATDTNGTGLGLAIVDAVARAHGGRATIGDSPLGGCRVTIHLPLAANDEHRMLDERRMLLEDP